MQDKLVNLLSRLGPRQKICIKDQSIVESDSWTGSLYRYWNDENREDLLVELRKLVEHLPSYSEERISQALEGLSNLLVTFFCHEIILLKKEFKVYVKKSSGTKEKEEPFVPFLHGHKPIFVIGAGDFRNLGNYTAVYKLGLVRPNL